MKQNPLWNRCLRFKLFLNQLVFLLYSPLSETTLWQCNIHQNYLAVLPVKIYRILWFVESITTLRIIETYNFVFVILVVVITANVCIILKIQGGLLLNWSLLILSLSRKRGTIKTIMVLAWFCLSKNLKASDCGRECYSSYYTQIKTLLMFSLSLSVSSSYLLERLKDCYRAYQLYF